MTRARIVFTPSGLHGSVEVGTTVLDAARRLGADLDTICGGRGRCGRCQVLPGVGRFAKWHLDVAPEALGPPAAVETDYRGARPLAAGHRLGCAATIEGDVVVDVPAASQVHRQVVRKELDLPPFDLDPLIELHYIDVPTAKLGDTLSAADLLRRALADQHPHRFPADAAGRVEVDATALPTLHSAIADRDGCTVALRHRSPAPGDARRRVVAAWPGLVPAAYGVAVDVGSTTIAGHLCNLHTGEVVASAGRMNPQIRFGEDLMSRVSYVMMNPGGDRQLTVAVREAIDALIGELTARAGLPRDRVLEVTAVGNPIMHHLLLGIDPTPLGGAPFTLATDASVHIAATGVELDLPHAAVYVGPCIAGHVGADTAAAILAEGPHRGDATQLLVDVGTNAEIVLGNRDRLFAASSPTGPAFEGAQLSSGQRATTGAIERVRIDPATLEPRFKVIGVDVWSDDASFGDALAGLGDTGVTGICGSGIIDVVAEMFLAGVIGPDGVIRGELAARTDRVAAADRTFSYVVAPAVTITQGDVRAVQLAKAALRAGIELLLDHAGRPAIDEVRLAGAFGAHIDPLRAMVLGLIPDGPVERVRAVGNAAGAGAVQALLSRQRRAEMERQVRSVVKIETATEPRFQELFVAAMDLPHSTAPTTYLSQVVATPTAPRTGGRRTRRTGRTTDNRPQETAS